MDVLVAVESFELEDDAEVRDVGEADTVDVGSSDETVTASVNVVTDEVVVVLGVTLGSLLTAPAVVSSKSEKLVAEVVVGSSSFSGHTPDVHGSVEQQPRKLPIVQTYHSLPVSQALASRGKRASKVSILGA